MKIQEKKVERVLRDIIEVLDHVNELKDPVEIKKYVLYARGSLASLVEVIDFKD